MSRISERCILLKKARAAGLAATSASTVKELRMMLGLKVWLPKSRACSDMPNPFASGTRKPPALRSGT